MSSHESHRARARAGLLVTLALLFACSAERASDVELTQVELKQADGTTLTVKLPPGYAKPVLDRSGTVVGWFDARFAEDPTAPAAMQSLDLVTPRATLAAVEQRALGSSAPLGERPVIVFIHGGTWSSGDKRGGLAQKAERLLESGFLLVSINYRLAPTFKHPAQIEDTAAALAWLHEHVHEYGGRRDGFVLVGHSAGAHLAALVATDERWLAAHGLPLSTIAGVVGLDGGGYHLGDRTQGEPMSKRVLASVFGPDPATWDDASPVNHVGAGKGIPPFLLFQAGDRDVSIHENAKFADALTAAGCEFELVHVPDRTHRSIHQQLGMPDDAVTTKLIEFAKQVTRRATP